MNPWDVFFAWPTGGIWSNLLASLIWTLPTLILTILHQRRHHKRVEQSLDKLHHKIDAKVK